MRYLLDSHIFLWYKAGGGGLSEKYRAMLDDTENELWLSVASAWELSLKRSLGKLAFSGSFASSARSSLIQILPVRLEHVERTEELPRFHKDPFDHILIAQALVEDMVLVTHNGAIARYSVPMLLI
jgi:PIN domain nuclease of toxin-antitoxin system